MTNGYAAKLRKKYRGTPVLLDANLLLLLLVGSFGPELVSAFKRLAMFHSSDLVALSYFTADFSIVTTPHVLTEISNLANALPAGVKAKFYPYMASRVHLLQELQVTSISLVSQPEFTLFGLTDSALSRFAQDHLLITNDGRLASFLRSRKGLPVLSLADILQRPQRGPA